MSKTPNKKSEINEEQLKAITHEKGPLLVVAGAGTGKTRVITERVRHLIQEKNIKPHEILALTFTEKASNEMLTRVGDIMPLGYEEPWIYTFHSFADRILRAEGIEIGLDPNYKLLSSPEQWILLRKNIFKMGLSYFLPLGNPTKFISDVLKFISRLQDENISSSDFRNFVTENIGKAIDNDEAGRWKELAHIYEEYNRLKLEKSRLDFGDLINWTIKLFKERPNILKKYQGIFKHVMIDEFQDTNYAQYVLIKLLSPENMGERTLLTVGDDSQSIYKFRGAAISNIMEFMRDYPSAQMVTLLKNYRSSQKILDPAYDVIQNNNPDTLESKLGISKKLTSMLTGTFPEPEIAILPTLEDEVEFVISKIYEILAKEPEYTYKDFAVLARANSHLEPFVMGLRQKGIPYQLVGNRGLYDRDEIRDILALLKVIVNPNDSISLYRVLNIRPLNIPYEEISSILSKSRVNKEEIWETVKRSQNDSVKLFVQNINKFQQNLTKSTPVEFVYSAVRSINYLEQYLTEETIENQLAIKNLDIFLDIVKRFEVSFHADNGEYPSVINLLEHLELVIDAGDNPAQAEIEDIDTVNLLTTHASKGLEYPVVFVVNLVSDRFPTRNKSDAIDIPEALINEALPSGDEHIQEERRLFYVAITRAKKYLFMTLGKNYGGKRDKAPSGFLEETKLPLREIKLDPTEDKPHTNTLFGINSGFRDPVSIKTNFKPDFLSYSQIDTYDNCPLQYKYKYILRIPTMPSHALSFGNSIHDTLRDFHTKIMFGEKISKENLIAIYQKNWQPLGYMDEDHRKARFEKGKELLEKYYDKNIDLKLKHKALEKPFNIRIDGIRFYGRIDRIDEINNNSVEIIDYKTGTAKTQKDVDKDKQVALYAIAAKEALGFEPTKLTLYFLEADEKITTTRTDEDLLKVKEEIKESLENIKKGDFTAKPGMICNWCDYKDICPFAYKN